MNNVFVCVLSKTRSLLLTPLLFLALRTSAYADPLFGPKSDFATGSLPSSVAIGDLNGDGWPDLAVANAGANTLSVLLGNGGGSFGTHVDYDIAGSGIRRVAIADLNTDGKPDVVVTVRDYVVVWGDPIYGAIAIMLGKGDGTLEPTTYLVTSNVLSVAIGDLNGDGKPDLVPVVGGDGGGGGSVQLGNGDGTFQAKAGFSTGGNAPYSVAIGDLNADGKPDLATANVSACQDVDGCPGSVSVVLGNGDGSLGAKTDYLPGNHYSVAIGDLNGDGKADLAASSLPTVAVLFGNGDGSFGARMDLATAGDLVAIGDLNGDGMADLVVAPTSLNTVSVLLGNGDGTFATRSDYVTGNTASSLAIGDLNGDGRPDLAVTNPSSNTVSVLLNIGSPGCPPAPISFDLAPNDLNLRSRGHWVTGVLEPEPPASPADIEVASIRLNGTVPVDASAPTSIGDADSDGRPDLTVKFDRAAVEMAVEEAYVVTVDGAIGGRCFEATDSIRVIRGHVTAPIAGSVLRSGSTTEVRPDGVLGLSDRIAIESPLGVSGPTVGLTLQVSAPNPGRNLRLSFTLPSADPAVLVVFDVRGRELSRRQVGDLGLGSHMAMLGAGRPLAPGVYFVHLIQRDRECVARAVVLR